MSFNLRPAAGGAAPQADETSNKNKNENEKERIRGFARPCLKNARHVQR